MRGRGSPGAPPLTSGPPPPMTKGPAPKLVPPPVAVPSPTATVAEKESERQREKESEKEKETNTPVPGRVMAKSVSDASAPLPERSPRGLSPLERAVSADSATTGAAVKEAQRWNVTPSKRGLRSPSDSSPTAVLPARPFAQTAPDASAIAAAAQASRGVDPDLQVRPTARFYRQ